VARARRVYTAMKRNPAFPKPNVSIEDLMAQIETVEVCIVKASDGSRSAIAERDRQVNELKSMLRHLAAYVEFESNDDRAKFISSGFEPASMTRAKTPPLSEAIRQIWFGENSGQLRLKMVATPEPTATKSDGQRSRPVIERRTGTGCRSGRRTNP
jgi:hypothetical protein